MPVVQADTLSPLLSGRLADAALALKTGSAGAWLWKSFADYVFPVLFLDLCGRNDVPVTGFSSLPDDATTEILKRIDGKDLARVECTSKQLRCLVTERDGVLWKAMYESLGRLPVSQSSDSDSDGLGSWKQRYVNARQRRPPPRYWFSPEFIPLYNYDEDWLPPRRRQREANLQHAREFAPLVILDDSIITPTESADFAYGPNMVHDGPSALLPEQDMT